MKRILSVVLIISMALCLSGCAAIAGILPVREYKGTPLSGLSYKTVDYMGGARKTMFFDFDSNTVIRTTEMPDYSSENFDWITESEVICQFTDDAEREFINKVYSYGLFDIKDRYENLNVDDGGGWTLIIDYSDGTRKTSTGSNAGPYTVFNNCAIPFYDLCGYGVVGVVPTSYYAPPRIDISVRNEYTYNNNVHYISGSGPDQHRGNYLWNGHEKTDANIYGLVSVDQSVGLLKGEEYSLVLYTANYSQFGDGYGRFNECVVKSYAIDPELSDGREVLRRGWFDQVEIPLELDRIYVVTLGFRNGDFVDYVFSTAALDQKIRYGEYHFNIYNEGRCALKINADGSFCLDPFDYLDENNRRPGEAEESLIGGWDFETIDGEEYLVLTADSGERLVFAFCSSQIILVHDKTALDLEKYHLESNPDNMGGEVIFSITPY